MPDKNEDESTSVRYPSDAGAQGAATWTPAPSTGEPPVDAMIARLDGLDGLPVEEHVAVFEDTHAGLRQVLSELDAAPEPPGAGPGRGSGIGR